MTSANSTEHFVTLFDSHYLPQGLSLYRSLELHGQPFRLWIVALDEACAKALELIKPEFATVISLADLENERLLSVKKDRSVGEYCWTLTPFLPQMVFERDPHVQRVTYLDADIYFFAHPSELIGEFAASGKHVLLTEHAFAPEYAENSRFGRFCVQFMTFRNTEIGLRILHWWQDRCIEWCYAYLEDGKFGDQKYLDTWPEIFEDDVHVLTQTHRTLAPWNVAFFSRQTGKVDPVFYHFHGVRAISSTRVVLYSIYKIGRKNRWIYDRYLSVMRAAIADMRKHEIPVFGRPMPEERLGRLRYLKRWLSGRFAWAEV